MMTSIKTLADDADIRTICRALSVPRASYYRYVNLKVEKAKPSSRTSPLSLTLPERQTVLDVLHSERFIDSAPAEVHATLLDEGSYHCSVRTMYRLLHENGEVRASPTKTKPALSKARTACSTTK